MILSNEAEARAWLETLPEWDAVARERLETLVALLTEENQRQNLVSATSLEEVWRRHIADSAQLIAHVPRETSSQWLDLGTGAGFPGLVVAALRPDCAVTMVESRGRRVEWLERARLALDLRYARIEGTAVGKLPNQQFSVISARAFAPLPKLLDLSARLSTTETVWLLPKGRSALQELDALTEWNHMFHVEQSLTDPEAGVIVGQLQGRKGRKA
jgi:16S rRNA (guanine527-N7)-methyltransferase